jgi:hypothetical protein
VKAISESPGNYARRPLKSYCGGHLPPLLPSETVLEILTYALVRSGFCAPHLPTEALQLAILATLFNSLQKRQQRGVAAKMLNFTLF